MIRLKENGILREKASYLVDELDEITQNNTVDYAVAYGEFMYKAGSWPYERRVVCKAEKPENQMVYMYTFVVTNMEFSPEYLIKFYCKRGLMENFIKESKSGFDFASVSSHSRMVNANRLQVHALAYITFKALECSYSSFCAENLVMARSGDSGLMETGVNRKKTGNWMNCTGS